MAIEINSGTGINLPTGNDDLEFRIGERLRLKYGTSKLMGPIENGKGHGAQVTKKRAIEGGKLQRG